MIKKINECLLAAKDGYCGPKGLQIMTVDAFFHDWVLMLKLEKLGQLTFFHLLNVDGVLSLSVDCVELKSVFLSQIDKFLIQF